MSIAEALAGKIVTHSSLSTFDRTSLRAFQLGVALESSRRHEVRVRVPRATALKKANRGECLKVYFRYSPLSI
jgi:hypothetical protein